MPTNTYTQIATTTLGSSASSVTFSSINQGFRDLIIIFNGTSSSNTSGLRLRFNSDSGSNYSFVRMWGENSSGSSAATASADYQYMGDIPTTGMVMNKCQIMDYSATDKHKSSLINNAYDPSGISYNVFTTAARWANTSAVTTIQLFLQAGNFNAGSTFTLFGIAS